MSDTLEQYDKVKAEYDRQKAENGPTIDSRLQSTEDSIVSSGFEASLRDIQAREAAQREQAGLKAQSDEILQQEALKIMEADLKRRQEVAKAKQGK